MVGTNETEFVIILMHFNRDVPLRRPIFERSTRVDPNDSSTTMGYWFSKALMEENSKIPNTVNIRYCEWRIQTSDKKIFKVFNIEFTNLMIIFGEETVHWLYYSDNSSYIEGKANLPLTWCGCCVQRRYKIILEAVMEACMAQLQEASIPCYQCGTCRSRRVDLHRTRIVSRRAGRNGLNNVVGMNHVSGNMDIEINGVPHYIVSIPDIS